MKIIIIILFLVASTSLGLELPSRSFSSHLPYLHRRGGASSGGSRFPTIFPPQPVPGPKGTSSSTRQDDDDRSTGPLWGSSHFDERPIVIEPRTVDNIKFRDTRVGLIRKVYAILSTQLFLTALVTFSFFKNPSIVKYLVSPSGNWAILVSIIASIGSAIALAFKYSRIFPINLLLLGLFTAGESVIIGLVSSHYRVETVLLAAVQTGIAFLGLTFFAFSNKNPKYDLTSFGSSLMTGLLIFVSSTLLAALFKIPIPDVVMGGAGALLFSVFLVYDTQRIIGGPTHEHQLDDKDYVQGALELYIDITRIFLYLLRMLARDQNE